MSLCAAAVLLSSVCFPAISAAVDIKIVNLTIEPVKTGQNGLRVEVQNLSQQNRFFAIHIQTRGTEGGWGKPFFEPLRGKEYKSLHFEYELPADICSATILRLRFYEPQSPQTFDPDNCYKKVVYYLADLEQKDLLHEPLAEAPVAHARGAREVLHQMQEHVADCNDGPAMLLLTNEFRQRAFGSQTQTFSRFAEKFRQMQFANLQAQTLYEHKGRVILNERRRDVTWMADFVQIDGVWKIDYLFFDGGDWKEKLLPMLQKYTTEHFDIYFYEDSTAKADIDSIAREKERGFREISHFIGQPSDTRICLVLFQDEETKYAEMGHRGMGLAYGQTIVEVYNRNNKLDPYHETTHILMYEHGRPPAIFDEGFAVYMSERLGAHALEELGGANATICERVSKLREEKKLIELSELLTYPEIGSRRSKPGISYPQAASFVKFLIEEFGKDNFLEAYSRLKNPSNDAEAAHNIGILQEIYGKSLGELDKQWQQTFN